MYVFELCTNSCFYSFSILLYYLNFVSLKIFRNSKFKDVLAQSDQLFMHSFRIFLKKFRVTTVIKSSTFDLNLSDQNRVPVKLQP